MSGIDLSVARENVHLARISDLVLVPFRVVRQNDDRLRFRRRIGHGDAALGDKRFIRLENRKHLSLEDTLLFGDFGIVLLEDNPISLDGQLACFSPSLAFRGVVKRDLACLIQRHDLVSRRIDVRRRLVGDSRHIGGLQRCTRRRAEDALVFLLIRLDKKIMPYDAVRLAGERRRSRCPDGARSVIDVNRVLGGECHLVAVALEFGVLSGLDNFGTSAHI